MKAYPLLVFFVLFSSLLPINQYCTNQGQRAERAIATEPVALNTQRPESTQIHSDDSIQQKRNKADPPKNWWIDRINAVSTGVIAFFAMVTALLAWIQIRTLKGVERPWAVAWVEYAPFKSAVERGFVEIPIVVTCKNFGRTPVWVESTGVRTWTGPEKEFKPPWDTRWIQQ